ncbi:hypothetical protein [Roseiflexus castenholzii]|uniref:Lipoprotein n=1 Tax=Roseiflexus castenholzii (strain DSM 13941 / HLO8) TaxID=383372 RepID=A7NRK0_ROSCS|nr:hypothetical protein [Roseiflexus castenholzii]ABU60196.1 conserved hypothetical protein [Roseiflexus castenholzii DSM 13941]
MRSQLLLVTTLLAGAISVAGCGNLPFLSQGNPQPTASPAASGDAATPATQPTAAAEQPTQAPANTPAQTIPTAPQTGGAPSTPATGDGAPTIPLPQSQANLAQLESYRITIVSKMNGKTTDGKTIESQMTYTQALHRPSKTGYTLVVENRQGAPSTQSELYSVGDMLYIYQRQGGKELCQPGMMAGMGDMLRGIADAMTAPLQTGTAQLVNRGETVNGVLTDRYTLDQETINQFGATVEKADLWVARDGGYLVKYDLTINVTSNTTGWAAMLGGGAPISEGTIVYNWSLEDINKTTITLPSACSEQTVGVDLPLPAGTQVDMAMPNTTMGKVNAGIDSVLTFFKTEYPKLGYELTDEYGDAQNGYILNFKKGADEVMVQFSTMSDGSVQITLTRG